MPIDKKKEPCYTYNKINNMNIYKDLSDSIIRLCESIEDKVYGSDLEDRLLEASGDEGIESYKEYEEINA